MGALFACYPRPCDKDRLLDLLPGRDHVEDRQPQMVRTLVSHLRRKLGAEAIESINGMGYRLGREQYEAMRAAESAGQA
jgi:DNA-binding response OmpR family regulator